MNCIQKWVRNTLAFLIAGTSASATTTQLAASEPLSLAQVSNQALAQVSTMDATKGGDCQPQCNLLE